MLYVQVIQLEIFNTSSDKLCRKPEIRANVFLLAGPVSRDLRQFRSSSARDFFLS